MPTVQDLIDQTNGQFISVTGPDDKQCTAIPHYWERMLGLGIVYGNAKDTFANAPDDTYEKELNGPSNFPRPGSIIVWDGGWGAGYGHTGVVVSANPNTFDVLEQNDGDGGLTHVGRHDYAHIIGWFYPRVLDVPAPVIVEAPPTPVVEAPVPADPLPSQPEPTTEPVVVSTPEPVVVPDPVVVDPAPVVITPAPVAPIIEAGKSMNKYLSRKFILTVLGIVGGVIGIVTGALSAGVSLTSATVLISIYTYVQGQIDKANAQK